MSEMLYQQAGQEGQPGQEGADTEGGDKAKDDKSEDTVDAEFEEVKGSSDSDKKADKKI